MRKALLTAALALFFVPTAQAGVRTRILYAGDWSGQTEIFAVDPTGKAPPAQITHWRGKCSYWFGGALDVVPSPDGRYVAALCNGSLWLMRSDGRDARQLVAPGGGPGRPTWSRNSRQLIYSLGYRVHVLDVRTGEDRVANPTEWKQLGWSDLGLVSPDRRWIAQTTPAGITLLRARDNQRASFPGAFAAAWSPDGKWLGLEDRYGIHVFKLRTRALRTLATDVINPSAGPADYGHARQGLAWSPDSRTIAFVHGEEWGGGSYTIVSGDLRTVTLSGKIRTLVPVDHAYGGRMTAVAWMRAPRGLHYQAPERTPRDRVSSAGVLAEGPIDRLAADGDRVAFISCDRVYVWTPATNSTDPALERGRTTCDYPDLTGRLIYYDLALAGDRLMYALNVGCNSITLTLHVQVLPARNDNVIEKSFGNCGNAFRPALGRLAGSGDLLVYGEWWEAHSPALPFPVTQAEIHRLDSAACPCPPLFSTPGPLYPADVNDGRVVAYGDNDTVVLNRDGNRLLSLPVSPQAAQLTGKDLVLLMRGALRDYDIRSGELLHSWPLPDVPSGPVCGWRTCETNRFVLTDAANGLVAYIFDDELHLLRLADGADSVVAPASAARFMNLGLVYADGARIDLVPYDKLPLLSFTISPHV